MHILAIGEMHTMLKNMKIISVGIDLDFPDKKAVLQILADGCPCKTDEPKKPRFMTQNNESPKTLMIMNSLIY